tara:strand:- start:2508 stop:5045 length:2538 start_codon:yes stop_codon:yes gene_type:complete
MTGSLRVSGSGPHYYMGRQENGLSKPGDNAKVGINTMIPTYELEVVGNVGVDEYIYHRDNTGTDDTYIRFQDNNVSVAADAQVNLTIVPDTVTIGDGGDVDFNVKTLGDDNTIYVLGSNDMVGIGMSNPTKKLHVTGDGHFTTNLTVDDFAHVDSARIGATATDPGTGNIFIEGSITNVANITSTGLTNFGNAVDDTHIFNGNVTASNNISASGFISSSHFAGTSASFDNIYVTGSGAKGTGSFGYLHGNTVHIHTHEIIGGQGLSVIGTSTDLGLAQYGGGSLDHNVQIYGPTTIASTLWVSASALAAGTGHISASSLELSDDLTIKGNISGSWISASRGVWTAGHVTASGNITSSGTIYAQNINIGPHPNPHTSLAQILATDIKIGEDDQTKIDFETNDEIHFYANNSQEMVIQANVVAPGGDNLTALGDANQRWSDLFLAEGGVINWDNGDATLTQTGNALAFGGIVEASFANGAAAPTHITVEGSGSFGGNVSGSSTSTGSFGYGLFKETVLIGSASYGNIDTYNTPLYIVTQSKHQSAESASLIVLHNHVDTDLVAQRSFIDFKFTDSNGNFTPQVKIGAEVGASDGDADNQTKEGEGAFVVYTTDASSDTVGNNEERLRVTHEGNVGIGSTSPTEALTVVGNVSASGNIKISGSLGSTNYRSFYVAAAGMTPGVTAGAVAGTDESPGGGAGTNYQTIDYLSFTGTSTDKKYANFQLTMPGEWDRNVLKAKFHYLTATATANTIAFGINMTPIGNNESMGFSENVFETIVDSGLNSTGNLHTSPATAYISASNGASASLHDVICFRVIRDPALDQYSGAARLLGVTLQYREQPTTPEVAW